MEGEDCRVIELGSVADKTGGQVGVYSQNKDPTSRSQLWLDFSPLSPQKKKKKFKQIN